MEQSKNLSACPGCTLPVLADFYYCPNCSKQLRPKPLVLSSMKMIGVCLLSFFLPPFGLYPAIKYIRQTNKQTKIVGWVAVSLTITAYVISIFSFMQLMQQFSSILNAVGNGQMTGY